MELLKKELKLSKEENAKLTQEIGKILYDKDKLNAEAKSEEKLRKIKKNTKLFNGIIQKQIDDGKIRDIDISKYKFDQLEEYDGGNSTSRTNGYGSIDLADLIKNKKLGGKRSSPQEQ